MKPGIEVAIVLLSLNQREKTLRCLESLHAISHRNYRIILWDNGSTDGTSTSVRNSYPQVVVHHHLSNAGVASGRNMAVTFLRTLFDPTYILFLDNDMTVEHEFLKHLIAPFHRKPELALVTAKIRDMNEKQRLYGAGGCRVRFWLGDTRHNGYGEIDIGQYDHIRQCLPSGGCMLVRTDVFDELGGFSSLYDPYGPEDLDFGMRAMKSGYLAMFVPEAIVFHETRPGRTFEGGAYTPNFAVKRIQHWFTFMERHASLTQKAGFYFIGVPYLLISFIIRQSRRGVLLSSIHSLSIGIYHFIETIIKKKIRLNTRKT